ncbi:hypothetical protein [Stratiformator vulcanicus]|uniref:Uncharacterized protein n=1 Tax=Stratiformator vulcanicus TaxID=2527980 RepID=A0A517R0K7_9PLAN|nr:hypothetical protein [Stratiformator vulcanicus]QDT37360.1 hypothetical protein Pan189_17330 [Stratiformator vulcanicus]
METQNIPFTYIAREMQAYQANSLERPRMYASSPNALDEKLLLIDMLEDRCAQAFPNSSPARRSRYSTYAGMIGSDADSFTSFIHKKNGDITLDELWDETVLLWKKYLEFKGPLDFNPEVHEHTKTDVSGFAF